MRYYSTEDEALEHAVEDYDGFVSEFMGQDCEDWGNTCRGWNPECKRCECGNRRVKWATGMTDRGLCYAYGEAY